jgi:arylsulfatase A-like enzyme
MKGFKMQRRSFLKLTLATLAPYNAFAKPINKTPNFIIIFADDQGYADLGCFGATDIKTPNIDRMAAEGIKFTDFYVAAPLCAPSRAALMTGCYPKRVGLAQGVLRPDSKRGVNPKETTMAETLKSKGYATGCIGKWHLGFVGPLRPTRQGFDFYYGLYHNIDKPEVAYFAGTDGVPIMRNEEVDLRPATPEVLTELYTKEAINFITQNKDKPFFLYLAHTMPHIPLGVSEKFKGSSDRGLYGDVIQELDHSTGRILNCLRKLKLDDSTIVIYTSDNGPSPQEIGSAAPLRGTKHTTYEGGMRVPAIMWSPGTIPAGSTCDQLATTMDLLPTFAKLSGAPLGKNKIDGKNIYPLMTGAGDAKSPHEAFYYYKGQTLKAVRQGKWKLHLLQKPELYNLDKDISESKNLADTYPGLVKKLKAQTQKFDKQLTQNIRPEADLPDISYPLLDNQ